MMKFLLLIGSASVWVRMRWKEGYLADGSTMSLRCKNNDTKARAEVAQSRGDTE
jgi:hypothetical protein